jgi:hypothetical protein
MPNEKECLPIVGYNLRLCIFSCYQIHPTSINKTAGGPSSEDGVTATVSETISYHSIQMGSCLSIGAKLLRKAWPKTPHCRFISSILVLISTLGILGILSFMACHQLYVHGSSSEGVKRSLGDSLQGITSASEGDSFGISEGANAFGFTISFADIDTEKLNTQVHFDTDSTFFVCDNSTTGHICNDIQKFIPDSIRQMNKTFRLRMGLVLVFKKGLSRFNSSTMLGRNMFSF